MKTINIELTVAEIRHIMYLVQENVNNGEHTLPKEQYWARSGRIDKKLTMALNELLDKDDK